MNRKQITTLLNQVQKQVVGFFGETTTIYRPKTNKNALNSTNKKSSVLMYIAPQKGAGPRKFNEIILTGVFDRAVVAKGDYLINSSGTYFVQERADLQASSVVLCNNTVSIIRKGGDYINIQDETIIENYPCGWVRVSPGSQPLARLPGDEAQPVFEVLLPFSKLIPEIQISDTMTDINGDHYTVRNVEFSDLGCRLQVVSGNV